MLRRVDVSLMFALLVLGVGCNGNHLVAQASAPPTTSFSDSYSQTAAGGAADILFVINNTDATMVTKATTLGNSATGFVNFLVSHSIDFHIAATSMDFFTADAPGCTDAIASQGCLNGNPRVIDPSTPNLLATFQANLQVGFNGDHAELGLDDALLAVTAPLINGANAGFLRPNAKLFVVFVSDEDDNAAAPGNPLSLTPFNAAAYVTAYANAKGGNASQVVLSAIAGPVPGGCGGGPTNSGADPGTQYAALVTASGGLFESICDADYTQFLSNLGFQLPPSMATFVLTKTPSDPSTIVVRVNGNVVPPSDYSYDPATNSITFIPSAVPAPGSTVVITYDVAA